MCQVKKAGIQQDASEVTCTEDGCLHKCLEAVLGTGTGDSPWRGQGGQRVEGGDSLPTACLPYPLHRLPTSESKKHLKPFLYSPVERWTLWRQDQALQPRQAQNVPEVERSRGRDGLL